ncbi:MBL fold metallo-hydrolase [Metabacillus arenae]|uniref:MBL fold metallo-hydrolase n=1 Tax=Metabacillus arenae TaxID=2771434 RepID=A0A926NHV9_9BACI|nr:MBL fold metallo-hydrolase [Metabacillus arenae]MBD1381954.1 MBL fold metallo-hydrolase [Metabacillus arenae]
MEFQQINENCYYFQGAVNIGYIHDGKTGLLIDAGLEKHAMKKVLKKLESEGLPITHLFITHAHADHYGGAAYLQSTKKILTFAPKIEEAILENPLFEPLYLFQGNEPITELRNKFLEGTRVKVDQVVEEGDLLLGNLKINIYSLPGHSINQLGLIGYNIFYCADAYFGPEQLIKHKIPFIIDGEKTLQTLHKIKSIPCDGAVPGHGRFEEAYAKTVDENIRCHEEILEDVYHTIAYTAGGIPQEELVRRMCQKYHVELKNLSSWLLYRTAVMAYVTKLFKDEKIEWSFENSIFKIKLVS